MFFKYKFGNIVDIFDSNLLEIFNNVLLEILSNSTLDFYCFIYLNLFLEDKFDNILDVFDIDCNFDKKKTKDLKEEEKETNQRYIIEDKIVFDNNALSFYCFVYLGLFLENKFGNIVGVFDNVLLRMLGDSALDFYRFVYFNLFLENEFDNILDVFGIDCSFDKKKTRDLKERVRYIRKI